MKSNKTGIARIIKAFSYSWDGFKSCFGSEAAFRQELLLCGFLFVLAMLLPIGLIEKLFLISGLFLVLLMELVNSAIEAVVDMVTEEFHPLAKKAKDIGSLMVLVAFIYLGLVWFLVLACL